MTRYTSGRRAEWLARDELTVGGYTVVRAAGSKGKVDLVAWNYECVRFIQIKKGTGRVTNDEFEALHSFDIPEHSTVEVWKRKDGVWDIEQLRSRA